MIWVPIFDSGDHGDDRLTVTSLGRVPFDLADLAPEVILPWAVVLACAATAKRFATFAHWPPLSVAVGVGLFIQQATMVIDLPRKRVESTDAGGEKFSALIVGYPSAGHYLWTIGCWALIAAGICGLLSDRRRIDRQMQRQAQRPPEEIIRRRQRKLQQWARWLPFVAVAMWIATIFIPVVDSFTSVGPRIRFTSLGDLTFDDGGEMLPPFILLWAIVVGFTALGLGFAADQWWNVAAVLIAALIVLIFVAILLPSTVIGTDSCPMAHRPEGWKSGGRRSASDCGSSAPPHSPPPVSADSRQKHSAPDTQSRALEAQQTEDELSLADVTSRVRRLPRSSRRSRSAHPRGRFPTRTGRGGPRRRHRRG